MASIKTLVMIVGPTAVGKTDVAIGIARQLQTVIISADSRQVYHEMRIGTATPAPEQLSSVPHFLIGHRSVNDLYNVSMYEQEVLEILGKQFAERDVVIMTGGTGLYVDVVAKGIDELPDVDPTLRAQLNQELQEKGISWLQQEVERIDPEFFGAVDQKNPARLLRALEVFHTAGEKISVLRTRDHKERDFKVIKIGLTRPREELNRRIADRVDQMMADGLEQECLELYSLRNKPALKTVGYREMFNYLAGECSLEEAIEKIKTNTRRYAKRQMTWFRRDPDIRWFHPDNTEGCIRWLNEQNVTGV